MRGLLLLLAAPALTSAMLLSGAGAPAGACACGGIVSSDLDARISGEQALLTVRAGVETVVMRLDLDSVADNAALIVPTPTPATASQAGAGMFSELERLTAPRMEPGRADLDEAGAAPGAAPTVVAQVQLGPLEATTLTGGELSGVRRWLDQHGYTMRPEVTAQLDPYLREGWSFVAMRLNGEKPLSGQLDPVRLDFASDQLVYPMRMSAAAREPQRVVVYTLGDHRMQRTDVDAATQDVAVDYAGSISGRTRDETLTELSAANPYLTRITTVIAEPASITTDFTFGPAVNDDPYQRVLSPVDPAGGESAFPAVLTAVSVVAVASGVAIAILRRRGRSG